MHALRMIAACSWCSASHAKAPVRAVEGSGSPARVAALSKQTKAPELKTQKQSHEPFQARSNNMPFISSVWGGGAELNERSSG